VFRVLCLNAVIFESCGIRVLKKCLSDFRVIWTSGETETE